jgi:hypothetical protein
MSPDRDVPERRVGDEYGSTNGLDVGYWGFEYQAGGSSGLRLK